MLPIPDYYAILGIQETASSQEVKRAYYKLARLHHPDKSNEKNEDQFKLIAEAYQILSDDEKRRAYHDLLEQERNASSRSRMKEYDRRMKIREEQRRRDEEKKKRYQNPDADFLFDENKDEIERKYRRPFFAWSSYYRSDIIEKDPGKLNPRTEARFLDLKHQGIGDTFPTLPNLNKRAKKYFSRMNRPYQAYQRSGYDLSMDLLQPLWGLGNLLFGALCMLVFVVTILTLPLSIPIAYLINKNRNYHSFPRLFKGAAEMMTSQLQFFASHTLLGFVQLVGTPFTWFVTVPLRSTLTLVKGSESFEKSRHIQRLISEAEEGLKQEDKTILRATTAVLHDKVVHALKHKKRSCNFTTREEFEAFYSNNGVEKEFVLSTLNPNSTVPISERQKQALQNYLNFFKQHANGEKPSNEPSVLPQKYF